MFHQPNYYYYDPQSCPPPIYNQQHIYTPPIYNNLHQQLDHQQLQQPQQPQVHHQLLNHPQLLQQQPQQLLQQQPLQQHQSHPHQQIYNPQVQYYHPIVIHNIPRTYEKPGPFKQKIIKKRTRTGCLTCRKRHIKCDERKPGCSNCEKSKKKCLGYEDPTKPKRRSDTSLNLDCSYQIDTNSVKLEDDYSHRGYNSADSSRRESPLQANNTVFNPVYQHRLPSLDSLDKKLLPPLSNVKRTSVQFLLT